VVEQLVGDGPPHAGGLVRLAGVGGDEVPEEWVSRRGHLRVRDGGELVPHRPSFANSRGMAHDRMPVILAPDDYDRWSDREDQGSEALRHLLKPYPAEAMVGYPVSRYVNDPRHEGPECVEPLG